MTYTYILNGTPVTFEWAMYADNSNDQILLYKGLQYGIPSFHSISQNSSAWSVIMDAVTNDGLFIRPSRPDNFYGWDDVQSKWVIDYNLFNPIMNSALDDERDIFLNKPTQFTTSTSSFYIKNDQRTQNAIQSYDRSVANENNENYSVFFYAKETDEDDSENIDVELFGPDIQRIDLELTRRMKYAFDAHRSVRLAHGISPFTSIEDAVIALRSELEGI